MSFTEKEDALFCTTICFLQLVTGKSGRDEEENTKAMQSLHLEQENNVGELLMQICSTADLTGPLKETLPLDPLIGPLGDSMRFDRHTITTTIRVYCTYTIHIHATVLDVMSPRRVANSKNHDKVKKNKLQFCSHDLSVPLYCYKQCLCTALSMT